MLVLHAYIHTYIHIYIYTYIHIYIHTYIHTHSTHTHTYEGCREIIQPFWISREPVTWLWCNLAPSQKRPSCAFVNKQSPVGLVSRQWDAVDWACVLCDCRIHNDRANRSASSRQCACPFYSSDLAPCDFWLFPKLKLPLKGSRFVNATITQYTRSVNGVSLPTD